MQVQHKLLITGLLLTTLQAEVGETTLTQSTTLKCFHGRVTKFYSNRLPAKIMCIQGHNPYLKLTEKNEIKKMICCQVIKEHIDTTGDGRWT